MTGQLVTPAHIIMGPGSLTKLARCVHDRGRKALLVTGRNFCRQTGLTGRILNGLDGVGCAAVCFERVAGEPDLSTCDDARALLVSEGCDVVVAVGGGSVLDTGKVVAGLANETAPTADYWNGKPVVRPGVPFIAVPTTSGSGSEVTGNGVITNAAVPTKRSIRAPHFLAEVAIVDPKLTLSCPAEVTAHSGMDALCQAIESYTSRHATSVTDTVATNAVSLLVRGLETAYKRPDDLRARTATAWGALLAGISMANARAGVVHGLAHPLGALLGIPHGRLCAVMLPLAMKLNRPSAAQKYRKLDDLLGGDADAFVVRLLETFGIALSLGDSNLSEEQVEAVIADALQSGSTRANPGTITPEDCRGILGRILGD